VCVACAVTCAPGGDQDFGLVPDRFLYSVVLGSKGEGVSLRAAPGASAGGAAGALDGAARSYLSAVDAVDKALAELGTAAARISLDIVPYNQVRMCGARCVPLSWPSWPWV
jgi:hypothetical protein